MRSVLLLEIGLFCLFANESLQLATSHLQTSELQLIPEIAISIQLFWSTLIIIPRA